MDLTDGFEEEEKKVPSNGDDVEMVDVQKEAEQSE